MNLICLQKMSLCGIITYMTRFVLAENEYIFGGNTSAKL